MTFMATLETVLVAAGIFMLEIEDRGKVAHSRE